MTKSPNLDVANLGISFGIVAHGVSCISAWIVYESHIEGRPFNDEGRLDESKVHSNNLLLIFLEMSHSALFLRTLIFTMVDTECSTMIKQSLWFAMAVSPTIVKAWMMHIKLHEALFVSAIIIVKSWQYCFSLSTVKIVAEKEMRIQNEEKQSMAVMYHSMKNLFASIGAETETLCHELERDGVREEHLNTLKQATRLAALGTVLCNSKRLAKHLLSQDYKPKSERINLDDLLLTFSCFSRNIDIWADKEMKNQPHYASADSFGVFVILENAINNACRHSNPASAIKIGIRRSGPYFVIYIINSISKRFKPRSASAPDIVFDFDADLQCSTQISPYGFSRRLSAVKTEAKSPILASLSEGKGWGTIARIVRSFGYCCDLRPIDDKVIFRLVLPIHTSEASTTLPLQNHEKTLEKADFPKEGNVSINFGLSMLRNRKRRSQSMGGVKQGHGGIEDRIGKRTGEKKALSTTRRHPSKTIQGALKNSSRFRSLPAKRAREIDNTSSAGSLKVCCIEDMPSIIKQYERVLVRKYFLPESFVVGRNLEELAGIEERILKSGVDACIVDQNLVYGSKVILGTDIIKRLRNLGYTGIIIVRSGNVEREDVKMYEEAGADMVSGKNVSSSELYHMVVQGCKVDVPSFKSNLRGLAASPKMQ